MAERQGNDRESRTLHVEALARVEGEGGMHVRVENGEVKDVRLNIFEPPRFFEGFMRGRAFTEAPDITARICGICPVAYQMSSCHAMEMACGAVVDGELRTLRRLLYCGEWIESHALHVFMLHAPDFLGYESAVHMAADHPEVVETALRLKAVGNDVLTVLGGRAVHPINVKVGGFYKLPSAADLASLVPKLEWARQASVDSLPLLAGFDYPDFEQEYEFVALRHPDEYPFNEGRLVSNRGLDIAIPEYNDQFEESHVEHSNALHSRLKERGNYFVGPLARFSLNYDRLSPLAREAASSIGLEAPCRNPFKSLLVRAVELLWACDEALRILGDLDLSGPASVEVEPRAGVGHGCTEAPRGILYHRYQLDDEGTIVRAQIVPPTSQNQPTIESDLGAFVADRLDLSHDDLTWQCEQAIRNYDPCISCATHFLELEVEELG